MLSLFLTGCIFTRKCCALSYGVSVGHQNPGNLSFKSAFEQPNRTKSKPRKVIASSVSRFPKEKGKDPMALIHFDKQWC